MSQMRQHLPTLLWLSAALALTAIAYWPGLHGGFLFDDYINLPSLGAQGPIDNWPAFWRYITSGTADPTGRPLTLLTFLLDARDWPASPYPFKCTSLALHMINGALLFCVLLRLGNFLHGEDKARVRRSAAVATALWLLHPLLVSTTLYIVQREAMLPATCVLAGLLIWMHGRELIVRGRLHRGLTVSVAGIAGFTLLGALAKANGALLPLFVLLIEYVVIRPRRSIDTPKARSWYGATLFVFGILPAAAIAAYLLWVGIHGIAVGNVPSRPWSYTQRLLTEPRVLMDYLTLLWAPRADSTGLFNDQYVPSTSLLHPASTLFSIIALAGLAAVAYKSRKGLPAISAAIGFFLIGHLIESSSIPLELYFEHRNYLPALLMFWPIGEWLADRRTLALLKTTLTWTVPLTLAILTYSRAQVWGDELTQALIWARINPDSARAQANAAQEEMQAGRPDLAAARLQRWLAHHPNELQISFNLIGARCMMGSLPAFEMAAAREAILTAPNTSALLTHWLDRMLPVAQAGHCKNLDTADLLNLIDAGSRNPKLDDPASMQDFKYLHGRIQLAQGQADAALQDFEQALDLAVRPSIALEGAALLGSAGYPVHGRQLLDHYMQVRDKTPKPGPGMPTVHDWILRRQNYWPRELEHIYRQLDADARHMGQNQATPPAAGPNMKTQ
ncbi:tetratricopeptide repeat protein [Dyella marensis]|uniref:Tetratricopeptide repeat-containing protein n=1 Tax=Dyella marensis TaxID=500610 RepID=A0A1I2IJU4_9GAMM|nr:MULTISPECIES: tetratricopeptide repeat protein [Dyella]SFF42609.1 hypothetical protein SAMN02799615_03526 [Dyella marensis]